jgi:hypothetical protein
MKYFMRILQFERGGLAGSSVQQAGEAVPEAGQEFHAGSFLLHIHDTPYALGDGGPFGPI